MDLETIVARLREHTPSILGSKKLSKNAVLLPLIQKEDGIHLIFEIRSLQLRRQPGEICFPGGRIDAQDEDEQAAAIRETTEELGISKENIVNVCPLDFMVTPFGMMVFAFAGFIQEPEQICPNPAEVGEIFSIPLSKLLNMEPEIHFVNFKVEPEQNFPYDLIIGGENYNWRTRKIEEYFYRYEDKTIWGMTARILAHFIEIIHQ